MLILLPIHAQALTAPRRRYWETVELLRKLALTSILALVASGSAGQVVVGLLIAFVALVTNLHFKPFAEDTLNMVNTLAQLNLFFVLFVALLLKVDMDGTSSSSFFSFIVGVLTVVPIALPIILKLYIKLYGGLEARMLASACPRYRYRLGSCLLLLTHCAILVLPADDSSWD